MDKKKILEFFRLGNMLGKMTEEELKSPQAQIIRQQYFALQEEYLEWKDIINDPEKLFARREQMKIDEALGILANGLNAYLSSPLQKPVGSEVYQEAFQTLVSKVSENQENQESEKPEEQK